MCRHAAPGKLGRDRDSDADGIEKDLKALAKKAKLKSLVLTLDNPSGPTAYKVAKDADVTVVLYNRQKVAANHAFRKGELDDKAVDKILGDLKKILPEK